MITPLFTSCPTFLCAQLPSFYSYWGKEGIILPKMHHDMAPVWPWPPWCQTLAAGGVTFRSLLSNENCLLWLSGCCGIGSCGRANRFDINDTKIRDRTGQFLNLQNVPFFTICLIVTDRSLFGIPGAFAQRIFFPIAFVSRQLLVAQSVYRSLAAQGGEAKSRKKNTSMAFEPTQLHRSQECSHIIQHPLSPHLCLPATWH